MCRRVQNETLRHRGRKGDPLWRVRELLVMASERVTSKERTRIRGLLDAGDPYGEVRDAWHAKENVRNIYATADPGTGERWVEQLSEDIQSPAMPQEINKLGLTLQRWHSEITNWHVAQVTNGPTEAVNNLIKRVKRVAFGFTNFDGTYAGWVMTHARCQTRSIRIHQFRQLPDTSFTIRWQTQLEHTSHPDSTLTREEQGISLADALSVAIAEHTYDGVTTLPLSY